jgi:hypothetical protein
MSVVPLSLSTCYEKERASFVGRDAILPLIFGFLFCFFTTGQMFSQESEIGNEDSAISFHFKKFSKCC